MTPRVSVVMPVYNGETYVGEAVTSVLASEGVDLELLLVDDGSSDASVARAEAAAAGDPRLRVLRVAHGGVARARNAGLHAALGEYIANVDCDDVAFPDRFARQLAFLDAAPRHVAVGARVLAVDAGGVPQRVLIRTFTHDEIDAMHLAGRAGGLANPAAMFRRAAALAIGGYDDALVSVGEDLDFWLRLAEVGRLANLPEVLIHYRVHATNVSLSGSTKEERQTVARRVVAQALLRRGLPEAPVERAAAPSRTWERATNTALVRYFRGERGAALWPAVRGVLLNPGAAAARSALTTILRAAPPAWPSAPASPRDMPRAPSTPSP